MYVALFFFYFIYRYLHVFPSEGSAAIAGRRSSEPNVTSDSSMAHGLSDRRASEPDLMQAEVTFRQQCSRESSASNPQQAASHVGVEMAESLFQGTDLTISTQSSEAGREVQEGTSNEVIEGAAAAVSSDFQSVEISQLVLRSKEQSCGICMDKIYEKPKLGDRVFGILPNCSHAFCLKCIMTWRKTRDLGPDVVKTCPQCRVRSGFYVPHKYWVEGQEKLSLIADFKEKCSTRMCNYFLRHGCCPFKKDCLYRHGKTTRRRSRQIPDDDDVYPSDVLSFLLTMALLEVSDEDDDDDDFFYLVHQHYLASDL